MDARLLLATTITLLYQENQLQDNGYNSEQIVREILDTLPKEKGFSEFNRSGDIVQSLRSTVLWMCDRARHEKPDLYDRHTFLQRIRVNVSEDEALYEAIEQGIDVQVDHEELKKQITQLRNQLQAYVTKIKLVEVVKKKSKELLFNGETVKNHAEWVSEFIQELEPMQYGAGTKVEGLVDEINFEDLDSVSTVLQRSHDELSGDTVLKTGWQAFNRMLGDIGGIRRGECVLIGALQHNFKSGMLNSLFKHFALYNEPHVFQPGRKPLLLHISFENETKDNLFWFWKNLKENETGQPHTIDQMNPEEAAQYVKERLTSKGWHIKMLRMNPSEVTYFTIIDLITSLEREGYEVAVCVLDYIGLMSRRGTTVGGPTGSDLRDLWRRLRNALSA